MKKYARPAFTKMQLNMESAILSGSAAVSNDNMNINREEATSQPLFYRPQITVVAE